MTKTLLKETNSLTNFINHPLDGKKKDPLPYKARTVRTMIENFTAEMGNFITGKQFISCMYEEASGTC